MLFELFKRCLLNDDYEINNENLFYVSTVLTVYYNHLYKN